MDNVQVHKWFFAFAYMKADEKDAASIVEKTENSYRAAWRNYWKLQLQ